MASAGDIVDKLVIFLAKRDNIDKLAKSFQYVSKLVHWHVEATHSDVADWTKKWEVVSSLSCKAFRTECFLTGFNTIRRNPRSTLFHRTVAVVASAWEMIYFFFDHLLWLSRVGVLDAELTRRMSFESTFKELVGYVFFILADVVAIKKGLGEERRLRGEDGNEKEEGMIRADKVMRLMAVAANHADLVIAIADVEPNPFCSHTVTLGISGICENGKHLEIQWMHEGVTKREKL